MQRDAGQNLITVAVRNTDETAHSVRFLSRKFNGGTRNWSSPTRMTPMAPPSGPRSTPLT